MLKQNRDRFKHTRLQEQEEILVFKEYYLDSAIFLNKGIQERVLNAFGVLLICFNCLYQPK